MLKRSLPLLAVGLAVGACFDGMPTQPADNSPLDVRASFAQVDASTTGAVPGFYFLPPLVKSPSISESFDPTLRPSMEVCKLNGNPITTSASCTSQIVTRFPAGSADVSSGHYSFSWDTDSSPENLLPMDPNEFYRILINLEGRTLGYLDIDPQVPSGESPGDDQDGLYAFRLGETIPVKVFLSHAALCETGANYVIQCTASAVFDETGGVLTLEPEQAGWSKLSVVLPQGALPDGYPSVRLTMERIDPDLFAAANGGEECIPLFDAPQFGDCLRVTTDPVLTVDLDLEGLVEMCIDPYSLGLPLGQEERLRIIRFPETGGYQALPARDATTCGSLPAPSPSQLGLLPVPDEGIFRTAAIAVNHVARFLAPEPLAAIGEIRLAGAVSNFSRFRWALPGEMVITEGDGVVLQADDSRTIPATVQVLDSDGAPVEGATVHFADGANVVTGADGLASTLWTVPDVAGEQTFTASALGLLDAGVPGNETLIEFVEETVTFHATIVGAPASATISGTLPGDGAIVASAWPGIGATVNDSNNLEVTTAGVVWTVTSPGCTTGAEAVCGTVTDNGDGTITWTLGTLAGVNTLVATVDGTSVTTTPIAVTTAPDAAHHVIIDAIAADPVVVGATYTMTGTVQDQYDNGRDGDALSWSAAAGGGSVSGADWTLGTGAGTVNTVTATVVGTDPVISAGYSITPVADAPDVVAAVNGDGQSGPISTPLAQPLVVQVTDQYGNLTPDQSVSWSATGGSAVSASSPYIWTLGPTPNQSYTATASVAGGSQAATFTATAICHVTIDGTMSAGEWDCAQSQSFLANISGGGAPAQVFWQNDGANLYLAVRVEQSATEKVNNIRFDFDNGNGIHDAGDDAIGFDAGTGSYFDQVLTAKCANSGQSGCGATDKVSNGEGAFTNNGTYTVYELSHPLAGDVNGEDFVRAAGENLGFFLTLRIGNGAQGNTQWPGFRVFQGITIR